MKFTCVIEINSPINKVVKLFNDDNNLKKWQEGFVSKQLISGTHGLAEAKSKIILNFRDKQMELLETILTNQLPSEISALYEHIHMNNVLRSCFIPLSENKTKMEIHIEYTQFKGLMPKLMSLIKPGFFKKQTQKMYDSFKSFVESSS